MATEYKPGEVVPISGIYDVKYDQTHHQAHQVTAIQGHKFPPCNNSGLHP